MANLSFMVHTRTALVYTAAFQALVWSAKPYTPIIWTIQFAIQFTIYMMYPDYIVDGDISKLI